MKTGIIALAAAALALGACSQSGGGPAASSFYNCGNDTRLKVDFADGQAVVQMNDNPPVTIPAVESASGAKYMSATHQFWDKGNEAMWTVGRMVPMTCTKVMMPSGM